jgi:hypothetical protein
MVSFTGYKQFAEGEKKMENEEETIRIKKTSLSFAVQVLSLILFGDFNICEDVSKLLLFVSFQFLH